MVLSLLKSSRQIDSRVSLHLFRCNSDWSSGSFFRPNKQMLSMDSRSDNWNHYNLLHRLARLWRRLGDVSKRLGRDRNRKINFKRFALPRVFISVAWPIPGKGRSAAKNGGKMLQVRHIRYWPQFQIWEEGMGTSQVSAKVSRRPWSTLVDTLCY